MAAGTDVTCAHPRGAAGYRASPALGAWFDAATEMRTLHARDLGIAVRQRKTFSRQ
jgi:hypothetical protein